ncbi:MAG TPA: hypothetical protein VD962_04650 [Rubricoccaceae bacterium]|nr:hypothetical protein [Rubricoccaceae bacterium]
MLPLVRGALATVRRVAVVSAGSAVVLWAVVERPWAWPPDSGMRNALLGLALLLVPAAATGLLAVLLRDLLDLPAKLRASAADASVRARTVLAPSETATVPAKGSRMGGALRAIWAARGLVKESRDGWGKAVVLARLARLTSLPVVLALVAAFVLNFVVIAAAAVAVGVALFF